MRPFALSEKFAAFSEHWRPNIVAQLNGQDVRLVKVLGVFPWHTHPEAEELFLVWRGRFRVELRDRIIELGPGEGVVVPVFLEDDADDLRLAALQHPVAGGPRLVPSPRRHRDGLLPLSLRPSA